MESVRSRWGRGFSRSWVEKHVRDDLGRESQLFRSGRLGVKCSRRVAGRQAGPREERLGMPGPDRECVGSRGSQTGVR